MHLVDKKNLILFLLKEAILHLVGLNFSHYMILHFTMLLSESWSILQSSYFGMGTITFASLAYKYRSRLVASGRLLIYIIKNGGPRIDP